VKYNPPTPFRDSVYLLALLFFGALYVKGVVTEKDLANWNDAIPALLALLAKLNVVDR
jgi:hypothetical protein